MYGIGRAIQLPGLYVLIHDDDLARRAALDRVENELRQGITSIVARAHSRGTSASGLQRALIGAFTEMLNSPGRLQNARRRWAGMPRQRYDIAHAIDTLLAEDPNSKYPQPPTLESVAAVLNGLDSTQRDSVTARPNSPGGPGCAPRAEQLIELIELAAGLAPGVVGLIVDDGDAEPSAAIWALYKAPASLSVTLGASDAGAEIARTAQTSGRVLDAPAGDPAATRQVKRVDTALPKLDDRRAAWAVHLALCPDSEDPLAWPALQPALSDGDPAWADEAPLSGLAATGLLVCRSPPGLGGRARREAVLAGLAQGRPELVKTEGRRAIRALARRCAAPSLSDRPRLAALAAAADRAEALGLTGFERGYVAAARRLLGEGEHGELITAACRKAAERSRLPAGMGLLAAALGGQLQQGRDISLLAVMDRLARHPAADADLVRALAHPLAGFIETNTLRELNPVTAIFNEGLGWEALEQAGDTLLAWAQAWPALAELAAQALVDPMIYIAEPDARFAARLAQLRAWATPDRPVNMAALARLLDRRAAYVNAEGGEGWFGEPSQADLDELAALLAAAPPEALATAALAGAYANSLSRASEQAYWRGDSATRQRYLAALRPLAQRYPRHDGILQAQSWTLYLSVDRPLPGEDPVAIADELHELAVVADPESLVQGQLAMGLAHAHQIAVEARDWRAAEGWLNRLRALDYKCPGHVGVLTAILPALAASLRYAGARGAKPGPLAKEAARRLDALSVSGPAAREILPTVEELVDLARNYGERVGRQRLRAHLHALGNKAD